MAGAPVDAPASPVKPIAGAPLSALAMAGAPINPTVPVPASPFTAPSIAAAAPLWQHAADDPSLRANVMPELATLSIDTGAGGELELHLRVKDGITDVRVDGAAAQSLNLQPQGLRAALASEGLALGSFESGQPSSRHAAPQPGDEPFAPRPAARAAALSDASGAAGGSATQAIRTAGAGVHITA
jgi:hypothetical protein